MFYSSLYGLKYNSLLVRTVRRLKAIPILALILILFAVPIVAANSCATAITTQTIRIWPVGTTVETGLPIVTSTPATLFITHTSVVPILNIWLLIVINKPTYDNLDIITINGTQFLTKTNFTLTTTNIPPTLPNGTTGYTGANWQYDIAEIKSNMNETGPVYYALKYFLPKANTIPQQFTLAVQLTAPASLKALILGLGYSIACSNALNRFTSFSHSTLIVPEIATLALTASPFAGLGLYAARRRRKQS